MDRGELHLTDAFLYDYMPKAELYYLNAIPEEDQLSHVFSKRFLHKINRLIKQEQRTPAMQVFMRQSRRVAMVFLLILSLALTTVISVEALRTRFFDVIVKVYHELTRIDMVTEDKGSVDFVFEAKEPAYVPEGFKKSNVEENGLGQTIIYENQDKVQILYAQDYGANMEMAVDTEDTTIETFYIGSYEAKFVSKNGEQQLIWFVGDYVYHLTAPLGKEELVEIAESIIAQDPDN